LKTCDCRSCAASWLLLVHDSAMHPRWLLVYSWARGGRLYLECVTVEVTDRETKLLNIFCDALVCVRKPAQRAGCIVGAVAGVHLVQGLSQPEQRQQRRSSRSPPAKATELPVTRFTSIAPAQLLPLLLNDTAAYTAHCRAMPAPKRGGGIPVLSCSVVLRYAWRTCAVCMCWT
jgi:hypothetical protein